VTTDNCVWVYAVGDDVDPGGLIGVGGGAVRPVTAAGLAAVVGDVPGEEFGQDALRRNLEDLEWLERTARTHHAVIEAVAKEHTAVPMRLATVYSSDEAVAGMLNERAADLREALARIQGRAEWGVKAYAATQTGQRRSEGGRTRTDESGAAYLKRRRAELAARQDTRQQALASADAIYAELGRLAVAARQYPPQSPEVTGRPASMVLNAAYLVPDDRADDFAQAVTGLAARHPAVQLALTGPWPPYSFVTQPDSQPESQKERQE
jgi:Gas vesicle synthesis protein GvpL/GvpF